MKKFLEKLVSFFKGVLCIKTEQKQKESYTLVYEDKCDRPLNTNVWETVKKGPSSWNKYTNGNLPIIHVDKDEIYYSFPCVFVDGEPHCTAIKTKDFYGDGKIEVTARFHGGKGTWPAIWMSVKSGGKNYEDYFEVDLLEYYETRPTFDTTYHFPNSMRKEESFKNVKTSFIPTNWNKFTCEWDANEIKVKVNNTTALIIENDGDPDYYPIKEAQRFFRLILSMQIGSKWLSPFDPNEKDLGMDVKSVKIWKKVPQD